MSVVVTGGMRGIGATIADAFRARGEAVAILDIDDGAPYPCDVSERAQVEDAIGAVESDMGPIDVLVNNAGIAEIGPSETLSEDMWRRHLDVLATGVFLCSQAVGRRMLERRRGSIVNIASINATEAMPGRLAYCAAKAAVKMMTEVLAIEWADRGIRVNAVAPGVILTDLNKRAIAKGDVSEDLFIRRTPLGRLGSPGEIARAALFLADGGEDSFITGATLVVDGGWSAYGYA